MGLREVRAQVPRSPAGGLVADRRRFPRTGRTLLFVRLAAVWLSTMLLGCGAATAGQQGAPLDASKLIMTFNEDFHSLSIAAGSGARWSAHTPWHGDFGDATFSDPGPDGPFSLTPLGLRITASQGPDGRWRSGLICSVDKDGPGQQGFAQQYGYFEMKARFPSGTGVWPAFWLIGTEKSRSSAEIDVAEFYGVGPGYYHAVATVRRQDAPSWNENHLIAVPPGLLSSQFNTYGVLIEPQRTRFYLNRRQVSEVATPPEFRQPMYMLVDLALGGGWPIDKLHGPQVMDVAYVRAFTRRDLQSQAGAGRAGSP